MTVTDQEQTEIASHGSGAKARSHIARKGANHGKE